MRCYPHTTLRSAGPRLLLGASAAILLCLAGRLAAAGADEFSWTNPLGGDWNDPGNWTSPTGTPPPNLFTDVVTFDLDASYNVRFQQGINNASLSVSGGTVQFDLYDVGDPFEGFNYALVPAAGDALVVGPGPNDSATLIATNGEDAKTGGFSLQGPVVIGRDEGSFGFLDLRASLLNPAHPIYVGLDGEGELSIFTAGFGLEVSSTDTWIGYNPGSMGTVTFGEAVWDNSGTFNVGGGGSGALTYSEGGGLDCDGDLNVAVDPGSSGVVTQQFTSTLSANASVYIGGSADGPGGAGQWIGTGSGQLNVGENLVIWQQGTYAGNAADIGGDLEIWPGGTLETSAFDAITVGGTFLNRGSTNVTIGYDLTVVGSFQMLPGSTLVFDVGPFGGEMSVANLDDAPPGSVTWMSGDLTITAGDLVVETLGGDVSVDAGRVLKVEVGTLFVGRDQTGVFSVEGGLVESAHGMIGGTDPESAGATVTLLDSGNWFVTQELTVADSTAATVQVIDGSLLNVENAYVASSTGTTATITIDDPFTLLHCDESLYLGGTNDAIGGTGRIDVDNSAALIGPGGLSVADTLKVWAGSVVEADNGLMFVHHLEIAGGSVDAGSRPIRCSAGSPTISIYDGGQLIGDVSDDCGFSVTLADAGSAWEMTNSIRVSNFILSDGVGLLSDLSIGEATSVTTPGTVMVDDAANLNMTGGTLTAQRIEMDHTFTGHGTLEGEVVALGPMVATGDLELGDPSSFNGVRFTEGIDVGAHTVTAHHNGALELGWVTTVDGGVLQADDGFVMNSANFLVGTGTVAGRFVGGAGSSILATGPLSIGDPSSVVGYSSDGDLYVDQYAVTLLDANGANLGILTVLGSQGQPGALAAAAGAFVDFEDNVIGYGVIDTPNDPFAPLINNGAIAGDSPTDNIELTGYVRGYGTLDNVVITGTDAPGLSTAQVYRGNVTYQGTLEIEIAGTTPGSLHDQINHSGLAALGGRLDIQLSPGYVPALGTQFDILTYADRTGQFSAVVGMGIADGKVFRPQATADRLTLVVVEPLAQDHDQDGDVDLDDFSRFAACVSGPTVPPAAGCMALDYDLDGDVDLVDFSLFQPRHSGLDKPAYPD